MTSMQGKVALITGGTSGIGRATAIAFARQGAKVVVTGRRETEGQETVRMVKQAGPGGDGAFFRADATSEADNKAMVDFAVKTYGRLDYAFNNAGLEHTAPIVESTVEDYRRVFDINVLGVMLSMKYEIPAMLKTGGGSIVNNASVAGRVGMAGVGIYVASKHAVIGLSKCAAMEVAKQNIRVNTVSPAAIQTDMFDRFAGTEESRQYMASLHPIGRVGKPNEIADPVVFLCSDGAGFITGHDLLVDGGLCVP